MAKRESQLPFSFNNDKDIQSFRKGLRNLSANDLKMLTAAADQEHARRAKPFFRNETKDALAGFLDKINFDYFCTFTTRKPVSLFATRRIAEKVCARVDAGTSSSVFWAAEEFEVRDGFHFHALMKLPQVEPMRWGNSTGNLTKLDHASKFLKMDLFDWYFKKYGRCQIIDNRDPERQLAASHYISKYVSKKLTDYDMLICKDHMK